MLACKDEKSDTLRIQDGIFVEIKTDSTDSNFFTNDNLIYKANWEYLFEVSIISSGKDSLLMKDSIITKNLNEDPLSVEQHWKLVPKNNGGSQVVRYLGVRVIPGNFPFAEMIPDYSQSIVELNYYDENLTLIFNETTGVIENSKNVWLHPHRRKFFRILELNPFPYVVLPLEVGSEWSWTLEIGENWSDYRWKTWKGSIVNKYSYKVEAIENIQTNLVDSIACFKVVSNAKSAIGITHLTAYYNETLGFVKLMYTNIDQSQVILNLTRIIKP